jgi:hypothetical protein
VRKIEIEKIGSARKIEVDKNEYYMLHWKNRRERTVAPSEHKNTFNSQEIVEMGVTRSIRNRYPKKHPASAK